MEKSVKFILFIVFLLPLSGCNDSNEKTNQEKDINFTKSNTLIRENGDSEDKVLNKIGISTQDDKIIIEPKKTKEFFEQMAKTLEKEAKKFESKAKEINISDLGIRSSDTKIVIDVNKTKNFLEKFSKELEGVAKELEEVFKEDQKF